MFLGDISACFILYLSAFIYKMGWLLYLAIFDQGFLAFFIIPTLYKIIHTGHLVFIFFSCLFSHNPFIHRLFPAFLYPFILDIMFCYIYFVVLYKYLSKINPNIYSQRAGLYCDIPVLYFYIIWHSSSLLFVFFL